MELIKKERLNNLIPLIEEYIVELGLSKRTTVDYIIGKMMEKLITETTVIMVDDNEKPTMFFWGDPVQSRIVDEKLFVVGTIFIIKEKRGQKDRIIELMKAIEDTAKYQSCVRVCGGAWLEKENPFDSARNMWIKNGYTEQELFFTKKI